MIESDYTDNLQGLMPDVLRLAESVCLAVYIEPALLRAARLRFSPRMSAGAEADLWFSEIVDVRNRRGFSIENGARRDLQMRLANRPDDLEQVWTITKFERRNVSPLARFEEELTWLTLAGAPDSALAERLDAVLATIAQDEDRGRGLAQWALRAIPRLPARLHEFEQTWALAMAGSIRLGGRLIRPEVPPKDGTASWLLPLIIPSAARRVPIGIRFLPSGIELSEPPTDPDSTISVPATNPMLLKVFRPEQRDETILLESNTTRLIYGDAGELRVRAIDGAEFHIALTIPPVPTFALTRRIFLSYASQNSDVAAGLTREWRDRGAEVFRSGEPLGGSGSILDDVEREIRAADVFVALISPAYLASEWCDRESRLAIQRENELAKQFIYVLEVVPISHDAAGSLGAYVWVNAMGELTTARLDAITAPLGLGRRPTGADAGFPGFRNRHDELNSLLRGLRTAGGRDMWVVVAPPLMGKTWLVAEVEKELVNGSPTWSVRRVDLRRERKELRDNPVRLVTTLLEFDGVTEDRLEEGDLHSIASKVGERAGPLLFVLDSAELLTPTCATAARTALTAVHQLVRRAGRRERFALLVATRRHDEWRGLGPNARTGQRFESLHLAEFAVDVIYQSLIELPSDIDVEQRWSLATRLQRMCEGWPALLAPSARWAARIGSANITEFDEPAAFNAVARGYIEKDLLAADSLLPMGAPRLQAALTALRDTLHILSPYRLYTQSHLKFHLDEGPALEQALEGAGWTAEELWEQLGRTALQSTRTPSEIWHEIERPLRRLLDRYYHPTDAERSAAHATAARFYRGWAQDRAAGREQQVVLVESIWHEAVRLAIDEPNRVPERLRRNAVEFARECGPGPMFQRDEFRDAVYRRLVDDDELQLLLVDYDGLFTEIVESVTDAIGSTND